VKLFIAIDLEGVTGVVSERDTNREGPAAASRSSPCATSNGECM